MALSGLVDRMDEYINRGDMYICYNKPQTAKGCYKKAFEKVLELESILFCFLFVYRHERAKFRIICIRL